MYEEAFDDDGGVGDIPWASVFDPAVNMRALSAIQARGFRAATEVIARFVRSTGGQTEFGRGPSKDAGDRDDGIDPLGPPMYEDNAQRLESWWQPLAGQLLGKLSDEARPSGPARMDLSEQRADGNLELAATVGGNASVEVWLHNGGPDSFGQVRLHCSDLWAHDGARIGSASVLIQQPELPIRARTSVGSVLEITVPLNVLPGWYRGMLFAQGHPLVWLPLCVEVRSVET